MTVFPLGSFGNRVSNWNPGRILSAGCQTGHDERHSEDIVTNRAGIKLLDFAADHSLSILNGKFGGSSGNYTYVSVGASVVDYIMTSWNIRTEIKNLSLLPIGTSDHYPIGITALVTNTESVNSNNHKLVLNITTETRQRFEDELENTVPPPKDNSSDVNILSTEFTNAIMKAAHKTGATKKRQHRPTQNKPWFDRDCQNKLKALQELKEEIHTGSATDAFDDLREVRREYQKLYKLKKKMYYKNIEDTINHAKNAGEYWNAVNKLRPRPSISNPISPEEWERFYRLVLPPKRTT